jgi:serine/threonine protein kinase
MPAKPIACDHELLRLSVADQLNEEQEELLACHLSECESCQHELDRLARGRQDWSTINAALQREADKAAIDADEQDEQVLAADFAVNYLESSQVPGAIGRLGDVDILEVIGSGGMGIVLKGFQDELKRVVAVKVLAPHLAMSGPARRRFAREAQAAASIVHPCVIPIFRVSSTGKLPYLVMPYLSCQSLQERIDRNGPLEVLDILRIGMHTASGLAAAHAQGIVHRDIKPANILLEHGVDRVMLTDFGLARAIDDASITRSGVIAGTPQFMSPEQARGDPVNTQSDLFSLGSVLYTMSTGRPPFRAETTYGTLRRITDGQPRDIRELNPRIPDWLARIIEKLLAKQPGARFESAQAVAKCLEECLAHAQRPTIFQLPESCQPTREPKLSAVPGSRARSILVAVSILCWLAVIAFFAMPPRTPRSASTRSSSKATAPAREAPPSLGSMVADDWDAITAEVEQLSLDVRQFEQRVQRPWDNEPLRRKNNP